MPLIMQVWANMLTMFQSGC